MTVSLNTSGSQTAVISTEHTLATISAAGTFTLVVDTTNMVNGDELELRVYGKARSTDAETLAYVAGFAHAQGQILKLSLPVPTPHYYRASLKQTVGTGRVFPWAVYQF